MDIEVLVAAWVLVCSTVGLVIGATRNRSLAGMFWGALLGPIGWLLVFLGPTLQPAGKKISRSRPGNW